MNKIVSLKLGEISELAKLFNVTPRTVNNALNGRSKHSDVCKRIRKAAIERGKCVEINR